MTRLVLFAHFDRENEIKGYVLHHLAALRSLGARIVFVSTSPLADTEVAKVRGLVETVLLKDNVGMDFGMWRFALERVPLDGCDELVLANSSVFGPVYPLEPIFRRMTDDPCDFWGMTDNFEHHWHLQSYFLVFKRRVVESPTLRMFFDSVLPYRAAGPIILSYEVGLTSFLAENGFKGAAVSPIDAWASRGLRRRMERSGIWNPTLVYPALVLAHGMPFVKVFLLRDNPFGVPLDPLYRMMKAAGYDLDLVRFDRPPGSSEPRGLAAFPARLWRKAVATSRRVRPSR
jgi:lipopolysaccharide biosynthesis protein